MDIRYIADEETEAYELRTRLQHYRNTAVPSMVGWIPFGLALILAVVTWQSWHVLYPGFARLQAFAAAELSNPSSTEIETEFFHGDAQLSAGEDQGQTHLSRVFTPQVLHWEDQIVEWAAQYQLDPDYVAVVMQIESCGYANAQSSAGALGLFQVMPYHFNNNQNPFDPATNAETGLAYLARSQALADGQANRALAGYNGGHGVIDLPSSQWSAETVRYVAWGTGILGDIAEGLETSPTLEAWLSAGGSALCSQASSARLTSVGQP
jgi:hypothetical protein